MQTAFIIHHLCEAMLPLNRIEIIDQCVKIVTAWEHKYSNRALSFIRGNMVYF